MVYMCVHKNAICECAYVCKDSVNAFMSTEEHEHMCVRCCAYVCKCICMRVKRYYVYMRVCIRMLCVSVHVCIRILCMCE